MLLFSRQILPGTAFSTVGHKEAFHGLGVQDVTEFNSGWCSILCLLKDKKKKKKGEKARELLSWGQTHPIGTAVQRGSQLVGAIKGYFKDQSLSFMFT
jgi:hypothetical protein